MGILGVLNGKRRNRLPYPRSSRREGDKSSGANPLWVPRNASGTNPLWVKWNARSKPLVGDASIILNGYVFSQAENSEIVPLKIGVVLAPLLALSARRLSAVFWKSERSPLEALARQLRAAISFWNVFRSPRPATEGGNFSLECF